MAVVQPVQCPGGGPQALVDPDRHLLPGDGPGGLSAMEAAAALLAPSQGDRRQGPAPITAGRPTRLDLAVVVRGPVAPAGRGPHLSGDPGPGPDCGPLQR